MHLGPAAGAAWRRSDKFIVLVLMVALVYWAALLTPSSYGFAFRVMGLHGHGHGLGLVLGEARGIRSDEWAVWTPYFQAAVNNHFARYNLTSVYHEDLRNFNALPLLDWGLVFKPQLWGFFVFEPARAFSLYHVSIIATFVIGWYGFIAQLGFDRRLSALASLAFFYTAGTQGWWTTIGPVIAIFPLLPWLFLSRLHPMAKFALAFWITAVWLIAHLYPPIIISLGFAGAVLVLAFQPRAFLRPWTIAACAIGAVAGAAVAFWYLRDPIVAMANTVYPGARLNPGGGMHWEHWLEQLLPQFSIAGDATYLPTNYLEATTATTFLPLFALCFAGARGLRRLATAPECSADRYALAVIAAAFSLITLWQLAPLPHWMGAPLLWDRAPPWRFIFASGALLTVAALVVLRAAPPVLSLRHFAIAAGAILAAWGLTALLAKGQLGTASEDAMPLVPLLALLLLRKKATGQERDAVAVAALAAGVLAFGLFNPLQSAWPIFHRPVSPVAEEVAREVAGDPRGWSVREDSEGAVLNGWGFRSVAHVLIRPQLAFFRRYFPDMPEAEFNHVFNRYAHVRLRDIPAPHLFQDDVIELPISAFRENEPAEN